MKRAKGFMVLATALALATTAGEAAATPPAITPALALPITDGTTRVVHPA